MPITNFTRVLSTSTFAQCTIRVCLLRRAVYCITLLYLSLPVLIFIHGWIRQPIAGVLIVSLGIVLYHAIKVALRDDGGTTDRFSGKTFSIIQLAGCLLPVIIMVCVSGVGGWGDQDDDWHKHNAILRDLSFSSWPVKYDTAEGPLLLVYYTAYYLPAAIIGRMFNLQSAHTVLFLWTIVGAGLSILWVLILSRSHPVWCGLIFVLFSGMDVVGAAIVNRLHLDHIEVWGKFWQYSSNAALFFWVPQHALPGWLLTALVVDDAQAHRLHQTGVEYLALSLLWTPFVTIGLLPLIISIWIREYVLGRYSLRKLLTWHTVHAILLGGACVAYFAARFEPYPMSASVAMLPQGQFEFMPMFQYRNFFRYVVFLLLEFGMLHCLIYIAQWKNFVQFHPFAILFCSSTIILTVLPWFRYGFYNDLVMRASIPSLFITLLGTLWGIQALQKKNFQQALKIILTGVLIVGSINAMIEFKRHCKGIVQRGSLMMSPQFQESPRVIDLPQHGYHTAFNFMAQYVGAADSWFVKYLAKPLHDNK